MRKSIQAGIGLVALSAVAATPVAAQTATPWLHVRVEEAKEASKVSVNLPLSVVEAACKILNEMATFGSAGVSDAL